MATKFDFNWQRDKEKKKEFVESLILTHTDEEIAVLVSEKWHRDGKATKKAVTKIRQRWGLLKPQGGVQKGNRESRQLSTTESEAVQKTEQGFFELLKENRRVELQLEKERLKTEKILDVIRSSIVKLPAYKSPKKELKKKSYDTEDMALVLSDSQIGQKQTLLDTSGLSEYNFDIFLKQAESLKRTVVLLRDIQSEAYNIEKLWILGVGDYIEGEAIYPGQAHHLDHIVVDQVFMGAFVLAGVIRHWCTVFPEVTVVLVSGQHGRGPKKGDYHWRTNWDYVFEKILQMLLQDVENCEVFVAESALCLLEIRHHLFLLNHGQDIRSWMTVPFYGLERATLRWVNVTRKPIDYVIIGDKHRNCSFDIAYTEAMINGAWSPGTKFSVDKMQGAGFPKQKLFGIHDHQGKTYEYHIKLSEPPQLEKDEKGFYTPVS